MLQDMGEAGVVPGRGPETDGKYPVVIGALEFQQPRPGLHMGEYECCGGYFRYFALFGKGKSGICFSCFKCHLVAPL